MAGTLICSYVAVSVAISLYSQYPFAAIQSEECLGQWFRNYIMIRSYLCHTYSNLRIDGTVLDLECLRIGGTVLDLECLRIGGTVLDLECLRIGGTVLDLECLRIGGTVLDLACLRIGGTVLDLECLRIGGTVLDLECLRIDWTVLDLECLRIGGTVHCFCDSVLNQHRLIINRSYTAKDETHPLYHSPSRLASPLTAPTFHWQ